jgi:hypothetical protein
MYVCEGCGDELADDDFVVIAARQIDVTTFDSRGRREYLDGTKVTYHAQEWPGDVPGFLVERDRGRWGDLGPSKR